MDESTFLADMEDLLEVDQNSLSLAQTLESTGKWDSLNFAGFVAMAQVKYSVRVAAAGMMGCKTLADLRALVLAARQPGAD